MPCTKSRSLLGPTRIHTSTLNKQKLDKDAPVDLQQLQDRFEKKDAERLIELFLASIPAELEKIKSAADKKDVLVVSKLVHSVKGASGMACIFGMQSVCRKIEESARSGDIETIREQIQELEREFGEVKDFLLHATKTDSLLNEQTL